MATVTGKVDLRINLSEKGTAELGASPAWPATFSYKKEYTTSGTGDGQLDLIWGDGARSLSAAEDLDLAGVLTAKVGGGAITWDEIAGMAFSNLSTTSGRTLTVGGKASNAFVNWVSNASDEVVVMAGGCFVLWSWYDDSDSYGVTASTGDILEVTASGALTYDVLIAGRSA